MVRQCAWIGLSLGLASTALAESGVQPARADVPPEIPSNGVLPLFGTCFDPSCSNLTSVVVADSADGSRVEGRIELVMAGSYEGWAYFAPTTPFRSGASYRVMPSSTYPGGSYPSWVRTVEPTGLTEGALGVQVSTYVVTQVQDRRCCSSCIDVTVHNTLEASATLSALLPAATQYLFAFSLHAAGEEPVYGALQPLRFDRATLPRVEAFDGTSRLPCYAVRARPITGGETFDVTSGCVDTSKFTELGVQTKSAEEIAKWSASCEQTTPSTRDAGAGSFPPLLVDASIDADGEPLGRGEEEKMREESGCQLASRELQPSVPWALFLLAVRVVKRRRGRQPTNG